MALLTVKKRKEYYLYLGLGRYSKKNTLKFQRIAFTDPKEHDGHYGAKTDKALRHWRNVKKYAPNFRPEEFKCGCGGRYCTGYPTQMRVIELKHIQAIRSHYGKPMTVTSGLRCKTYNDRLSGSSRDSLHMKGRAVDFYMPGVTDTLEHRKKAIKWIRKQPRHHYTYGNGINSNGYAASAPNMGNALHTDTQ